MSWSDFVNWEFSWIKWFLRPIELFAISVYKLARYLWAPFDKNLRPLMTAVFLWIDCRKTYIVSIAGIIGILWGFKHHTVNLGELITSLPILITAITIRYGQERHAVSVLEGGDVPVPPLPSSSSSSSSSSSG